MKKILFLAAMSVISTMSYAVEPLVIDSFQYADDAAVRAAWRAEDAVSPSPSVVAGLEGKTIARFACPFQNLADWRVFWDREVKLDLHEMDRIKIRLRCADPDAIGSCMLYAHSVNGWFTMDGTGVTRDWGYAMFLFAPARREDKPTGWQMIDRLRLAFLPAAKRDTFVEVDRIEASKGSTVEEMAAFGGFKTFDEAQQKISAAAKGRPTETDVAQRLADAAVLKGELIVAADISSPEMQNKIVRGRRLMAEAYAMVQDPKPGELRGFWCHNGDGPLGKGGKRKPWSEAIPQIADAGFSAIFPNMLWSGVAFYPSKVVPTSPKLAAEGDQLAECIAAAHARGVQVHMWKVSWQFPEWYATKDYIEKFRADNRLQVNLAGKTVLWLCPSDPRNRKYELDAFLEAADYDVDGLHLDYIRYGGQDVCFCDGCHQRFEEQTGKKVGNWPVDVSGNGALVADYNDWKREQITSFVRELRQALKKKKPRLKLSAAVFSNPESARTNVYQDWPRWVREGLLDFVCTMTYTESLSEFRSTVRLQTEAIGGRVPLYTGMFATYGPNRNQDLATAVDQIRAERELGASGFVLFELENHLFDQLLPYLRAGVTRP